MRWAVCLGLVLVGIGGACRPPAPPTSASTQPSGPLCCRLRNGEHAFGDGSCGPFGVEVGPEQCGCCCERPDTDQSSVTSVKVCSAPGVCQPAESCGASAPQRAMSLAVRVPAIDAVQVGFESIVV